MIWHRVVKMILASCC